MSPRKQTPQERAVLELMQCVQRVLKLAPKAGLYVGITLTEAPGVRVGEAEE